MDKGGVAGRGFISCASSSLFLTPPSDRGVGRGRQQQSPSPLAGWSYGRRRRSCVGDLSAFPDDGSARAAVKEVDFFSAKRAKTDLNLNLMPSSSSSFGLHDLDIHNRLNLLVENSIDNYNNIVRKSTELAALEADLARKKEEKQTLTEMLKQTTTKYESLEMQVSQLMQNHQQQQPIAGRGEAGQSSAENKEIARATTPYEISEQDHESIMKKACVCVRIRTDQLTIHDGCKWRKYGLKDTKGSKHPRAYYKCTMPARDDPKCPARKRVQRCAEDKSILVARYEGTHNHPLPAAAMAMATSTMAAASMLLSASTMSTAEAMMNPADYLARAVVPFASGVASISASAPFPTVTLDLTQNPNAVEQMTRPPGGFFSAAEPPQLPQVFEQALRNHSQFAGMQLSAVMAADPDYMAAITANISSIINGHHQAKDDDDDNVGSCKEEYSDKNTHSN